MKREAAAVLVVLALLGPAAGASAQSIEDRLDRARAEQERAALEVRGLQDVLRSLGAERARLEGEIERVTRLLLRAYERELDAQGRLDRAEGRLDDRARAAYQLGPVGSFAVFLVADDPAELATAQEYAASAMEADVEAIEEVERARAVLEVARGEVEDRKAELGRDRRLLSQVLATAEEQLAMARAQARSAGTQVARLEEELRAIEEARRRAARQAALSLDPAAGTDQEALLALLGPTGGRTCEVPEGLEDTGQQLSGLASWYGWDFAGQHTASGAVFDPRLFTAAHRDLPFGTFLRVRWQGNCVIVLVNDRGPYGDYDRIIDLSLGAAQYLGTERIGVAAVEADILVPA
ncbi:MAG: septal ring lytic transglycosylase RlpA family protein [Actinobacteria bacterium]|nr:septal ring lytic transglycosylase RlpA family protein [Actinomycetota bacterium]